MSDGGPGQEGGGDAGGVFGNLPGSRPGSRSPRRRSGEASAAPKATPRKRATAPGRKPAPPPEARRPAAKRVQEPVEPDPGGAAGLEDVAWAGVAVAAEAATIGVRLASRAIEALRGSTERGSERG
jgi:hypothetical protein